MASFEQIVVSQLGISMWLFVVILVWSWIWKVFAFWKSARRNHLVWFIVFVFVNTLGILEVLYLYVFSEMGKPVRHNPKKAPRRR